MCAARGERHTVRAEFTQAPLTVCTTSAAAQGWITKFRGVTSQSIEPVASNWWANASCRGRGDRIAFFPGSGEDHRPALRLCSECPVRRDCLADALDRRDPYGVWGGTLPEDRHLAELLDWDLDVVMTFADRRITHRPSMTERLDYRVLHCKAASPGVIDLTAEARPRSLRAISNAE